MQSEDSKADVLAIVNQRFSADRIVSSIIALLLIGILSGPAFAGAHDINPDRILVKFKPGIRTAAINSQLARAGTGVRTTKTLPSTNISIIELPQKGTPIKEVVEKLKASGLVDYAEPDHRVNLYAVPDDPQFDLLWGLHNTGRTGGTEDADIDAPEAWDITTGSKDIVVAVLDTGVDYTHPDLAPNMWTNPGEVPDNDIDDDDNGYIDDVHGIDTVNDDGDPTDMAGHGTHCAGTIGAGGSNGIGVTGVNWNVSIMALQMFDSDGMGGVYGKLSNAIACLDYAIMMKTRYGVNIKVTSNSWGSNEDSQALADAIQAAADADILFVAAAGNFHMNNDDVADYPSGYDLPNIISVAATDHNDILANFSNHGVNSVDLGAPGVDILSTGPSDDGYISWSGTSMATPHAAGAAALVWSKYPDAGYATIKGLLLNTVDQLDALSGLARSSGRLNVYNALTCQEGEPRMIINTPVDDFITYPGHDQLVMASLVDCAEAITGATILVTPDNGDAAYHLKDDGVAPDDAADDGVYSANWSPTKTGPVTLNMEASGFDSVLSGTITGKVNDLPPDYSYDDKITYEWIDATGGLDTGITKDGSSKQIDLGFDFKFYGERHNKVRVSSRGYLTFSIYGDIYSNTSIPSVTTPNNIIAPLWSDLEIGSGGGVYYLLEGEAPNRRLTIEWHNMHHYHYYEDNYAPGPVTFEATLYEGSNDIVFRYKDVVFGDDEYGEWDNGASAAVGIEDFTGTIGLEYSYNDATIKDETAILFTTPDNEGTLDIEWSVNDSNFTIGDKVDMSLSIANNTTEEVDADIWIYVEMPDGTKRYYPTFRKSPNPVVTCWNIEPGPFLKDFPFFTLKLPRGSEGNYKWYAILVPCDADVTDPSNWLASSVAPITVEP